MFALGMIMCDGGLRVGLQGSGEWWLGWPGISGGGEELAMRSWLRGLGGCRHTADGDVSTRREDHGGDGEARRLECSGPYGGIAVVVMGLMEERR